MNDSEDMQTTIFGDETPTSELPRLNCTRREDCPAEADEHEDDCPVEGRLRAEFGF